MIRIDKEFVYLDKGATLLPFKTSIIILLIKVNPLYYPLFLAIQHNVKVSNSYL